MTGPESERDVPGALGGSRILAHPEVAARVAALRRTLEAPRPSLLEIGFDHGRRLTATAAANPDWSVIGLEVRRRRVDEVTAWAAREGLENLHAYRLDARTVLANALLEASVDRLEALFPTPWPEGKARRRLLVTPALARDVARVLKPGGTWVVATDVDWYAALVAVVADDVPALVAVDPAVAQATRPACAQRSRREWTCEREGLTVHRFAWVRAQAPSQS